MKTIWENTRHAANRAQITQDFKEGSALRQFIAPKKPRTWGDLAKDCGEVAWDAAYEGVAKDVIYEGLVRKVIIGAPVAAYTKWVRPAKAVTNAPAVPGEIASAEAPAPEAPSVVADAVDSDSVRRCELFTTSSLGKSRRMRPLVGSFKATNSQKSGSSADDAQTLHRRELFQSLSSRRSSKLRFEPTRFTDREIAEIEESWAPASQKDINKQLKSGSVLDSNVPNALAVVRPGQTQVPVSLGSSRAGWRAQIALPFELDCDEPMVAELLAAILKDVDVPADVYLTEPVTLGVRMRGLEFQRHVAEKVMALGKVQDSRRLNGDHVDIDEQVFFTLFDGLLRRGAQGVGASARVDGKPLYEFLADANGVEFMSTHVPLARFLNECMQSNERHIRDLRMRLALFEVAKLNYFENAEIKEATKEFLAGTIVGALGEIAIEFIPAVNKTANFDPLTYVLNVVFGGGVDFIDNYKGRMGAVTMGAANADAATLKQQQRSALMASACGAAYGTLFNFAAQYPIALKDVSTWWLMAGTAFSIVGSSLSIPFQMQADRARKTATVVGLLKRDIAHLPDEVVTRALAELGVEGAPASAGGAYTSLMAELRSRGGDLESADVPWQASRVVRDWAAQQAISDMSMSIASTSSSTGFMVAPLLSALWGINFASHHIRTPLQAIIFGTSPGAENLSTAGAAVGVAKRARAQMAQAARTAIAMAAKGPQERPDLDDAARASQAHATLGPVSMGITRGLSAFGTINVRKQSSLL